MKPDHVLQTKVKVSIRLTEKTEGRGGYKVVQMTNTIKFYVGEILSEGVVNSLIHAGWKVTIC